MLRSSAADAVVFVGGNRPGWVTVSRERTSQRSGLLLAVN
jgi:hypothetical protein